MDKLGIPFWPDLEKPRDRLVNQGAETLSDAQLLAILIRMGCKGQTAIDVAMVLLNHFNGLSGIAGATVHELCQIDGMGPSKAAQIHAAFEVGKRNLSGKKSKKGRFLSSKEIYLYFFPEYSSLKIEVFKIILLDTKNGLIKDIEVSKGSLNQTVVHPREIFNLAIRESAASLILIHNHPSGDPAPSPEDNLLTQKMVKAGTLLGIPVLDHLIIGKGDYYSYADCRTLGEK
ncbi:MAG: DNA repair protein RadC [Nitrospirae bacterium]|nr:DNA repair protein RadC [Nitrospirota bacterium]MBI3604442.1 DNA repair protein RadC [Nitrospirota bacterium]